VREVRVPFALPACGYRFARAKPACADAIPDGYVHYLSVQHKPIQTGLKRLDRHPRFVDRALPALPSSHRHRLAVMLGSRGPILFKQQRVGLHGRTFDMLKFRSMVRERRRPSRQARRAKTSRQGPSSR
jgi:hypothetical protein